MGYERDRDHATRGPGAIAALDRTSGPRYQRRQAAAQASVRRDRAMSAIERGALGRIDLRTEGRPTPGTGITKSPPPLVKVAPPIAAATPPIIANPNAPQLLKVFPIDPVPMPLPETTPAITKPTLPTPGQSPPIIAPPAGTTTIGGGTGTVRSTGGLVPKPPLPSPGTTPPLPDIPPTAPGGGGGRTALLVGGAALAAYLLFFRKGGDR